MRPPMKQTLTLLFPTGEEDDYGKPLLDSEDVKARVQYSSKVIKSAKGTELQSSLEVDIMPDVPIEYGTKAEYIDPLGKVVKGSVIDISDATNIAGNKVYFRTVLIG